MNLTVKNESKSVFNSLMMHCMIKKRVKIMIKQKNTTDACACVRFCLFARKSQISTLYKCMRAELDYYANRVVHKSKESFINDVQYLEGGVSDAV